jgi:hypothetical protein
MVFNTESKMATISDVESLKYTYIGIFGRNYMDPYPKDA